MVFVSNNPVPYHTSVLNALNTLLDLDVVYMSRRHPMNSFVNQFGDEPQFRFTTRSAVSVAHSQSDFRTQVSIGVSASLLRLDPDVVLFSGWGPLVVEPLLWAAIRHRSSVMWAESTAFSGLLRGAWSNWYRRRIVSLSGAFVTNGTKATEYLRTLGASDEKIWTSCFSSGLVVADSSLEANPTITPGTRILFVGRLVELKRPFDLIEAFRIALLDNPALSLTIVGDGPLRTDLEHQVGSTNLAHVAFLGRVEGPALSRVYSSHDILVLPSQREVWGLVVNEALLHGLFAIATVESGASHDLITAANGRIVNVGDSEGLAKAILECSEQFRSNPESRSIAKRSVAHCTPMVFAQQILAAARAAVDGG